MSQWFLRLDYDHDHDNEYDQQSSFNSIHKNQLVFTMEEEEGLYT